LGRYDAVGYPPAGYLWDIDSLWYVPTSNLTYWAPNYGTWYSNPRDKFAMRPEGEIRQTQVLYDQLQREADDAARIEVGRKILALHDKNVWMIGTVKPPFSPVVVADDLANVRETAVASFRTHYEGATDLAQIYFKNPDQHR
jgi:peptide/nickel transport system substrate-binding protein